MTDVHSKPSQCLVHFKGESGHITYSLYRHIVRKVFEMP